MNYQNNTDVRLTHSTKHHQETAHENTKRHLVVYLGFQAVHFQFLTFTLIYPI